MNRSSRDHFRQNSTKGAGPDDSKLKHEELSDASNDETGTRVSSCIFPSASLTDPHDIPSTATAPCGMLNTAAASCDAHEFLNAVIANSPHIVFWKDRDGTYLGCNENFLSLRNLRDRSEVIGKKLGDFALDRDEAKLAESVDTMVIETGTPSLNAKKTVKTQDGTLLSIESSKMPIHDADGRVIGLVGIASDVTEKELAERKLQQARISLERRVKERTQELEKEIFDRKQVEEALRESEQKYRTLIEGIHDGVFLIEEGKFLFLNDAFPEMLDYKKEELLGQSFLKVVAPEFLDFARDQYQRRIAGEKVDAKFELDLVTKNGSRRHILIGSDQAALPSGTSRVIGTARDITDRILAEKAVIESEERFREFAEFSSDWLWETDGQGRFTYISDRAQDLLGFRRDDVIGKNCEDLSSGQSNQIWATINDFIRAGGTFRDFEIETHDVDGKTRYARISGKPRFDGEGQFIGYRGTGTDITERVNSGRREREAEERYLTAIETVPLAVALFNDEDRLVSGNERFRRNLISPGELPLGSTFEEIVRSELKNGTLPEAEGREEAWLETRLNSHRTPSGDILLRRHNGWFQVAEHRTADGYTLIVYQDITERMKAEVDLVHARDELELRVQERTRALEQEIFERKYAEAELQKSNEELEKRVDERTQHLREEINERRKVEEQFIQAQKMEAVGQLAGGIAHDFNNLLTVIIGNLSWLEEFVQPHERALKVTGLALEGARRAGDLTHRMLTFSRHRDLNPVELDLKQTVAGIEPLITRALRENIRFETDVGPEVWPMMADPHQLENAVLNIAINSRDAMPDGGTLILRAENCVIDKEDAAVANGEKTGEFICLSMIDAGTGMPPELRERVFDPFFTTKEVGKGSGLGLSMVFGFVNQSGGFIEIDSEVGKGTAVKMNFRRAARLRKNDTEPLEPEVPDVEGLKILVVEDDALVRDVTIQYLKMSGIDTREACDGASAITALEKNGPVDLVVSDVMMPGMSGVDLKETVIERWPETRFLLISGYSYDEFSRRGIDRDAVGLLPKPFSKSQLLSRVGEVMSEN